MLAEAVEADREWRRSASARQEWVLARRQRESARQQAKAGAGGGGSAGGGSRPNDDTASPGRSGAGVAAAASAAGRAAGAAGAAVPRVKGKGVRVVVRDDLSAYHPHLMHQVCAREPLNPAPCTPNPIIATACTRSMLACRAKLACTKAGQQGARTHACLSGCDGGVRTRQRGSEGALVLAMRRVKRRVR